MKALNLWWKQSTKHHSLSSQTWSQQNKWNSHVLCVLHKVLYCKNSKMRFLWHHSNGKIDCICTIAIHLIQTLFGVSNSIFPYSLTILPIPKSSGRLFTEFAISDDTISNWRIDRFSFRSFLLVIPCYGESFQLCQCNCTHQQDMCQRLCDFE